jgi:hypothetical protein
MEREYLLPGSLGIAEVGWNMDPFFHEKFHRPLSHLRGENPLRGIMKNRSNIPEEVL